MVLNTTYNNKEHKNLIINTVGKGYSFFEALKIGGIGSKRMIINKVSPNLKKIMNATSDINYANIEIRKEGILVFINKGLQNYTWSIPYHQLHIYKTEGISIHAQGKYIQFQHNKTLKENKKFLDKMMHFKATYNQKFKFQ